MLFTRFLGAVLLLVSSCYATCWSDEYRRHGEKITDIDGEAPIGIPEDLLSLIFKTDFGHSRIGRCLYESLGFDFEEHDRNSYDELISALIFGLNPIDNQTGMMNLETIVRVQSLYRAAERALNSDYGYREFVAFCFLLPAEQLIKNTLQFFDSKAPHYEWAIELEKDIYHFNHLLSEIMLNVRIFPLQPPASYLNGSRQEQNARYLNNFLYMHESKAITNMSQAIYLIHKDILGQFRDYYKDKTFTRQDLFNFGLFGIRSMSFSLCRNGPFF